MAKPTKIADIYNGAKHYVVTETKGAVNPYRVWVRYWSSEAGAERCNLLEPFADMKSAILFVASLV